MRLRLLIAVLHRRYRRSGRRGGAPRLPIHVSHSTSAVQGAGHVQADKFLVSVRQGRRNGSRSAWVPRSGGRGRCAPQAETASTNSRAQPAEVITCTPALDALHSVTRSRRGTRPHLVLAERLQAAFMLDPQAPLARHAPAGHSFPSCAPGRSPSRRERRR